MLERASACLDSGVRLSLRATRQTCAHHKSRRLLHRHFWLHAAPDLDLLPWPLSSSSLLPSLALPSPPSPSANSTTPSDGACGPYLDFLYPPQALAFMTDRTWDRHSARNASVNRPRPYSSMTPSHSPSVAAEPRQDPSASSASHPADHASDHPSDQPPDLFSDHPLDHSSGYPPDRFSDHPLDHPSDYPPGHFSPHPSDHPSDHPLDNVLPTYVDVTTSPIFAARNIDHLIKSVSAGPLQEEDIKRARSLLALLDTTSDETLPRLRRLFTWLLQRHRDTQDPESRDHVQLLIDTLWRSLVDLTLPGLGVRSANRYIQSGALLKSCLRSLHTSAIPSSTLYHHLLHRLLDLPFAAKSDIVAFFISRAYSNYVESGSFNPTQTLLARMIRFWSDQRRFMSHKLSTRRSFASVKLERLVDDVERFHAPLTDGMLLAIMNGLAHIGDAAAVQRYAHKYLALHPKGLPDASLLWPLLYVHAANKDPKRALDQLDCIESTFGVAPDLRCWNTVIHIFIISDDGPGALNVFDRLLSTDIVLDAYTFAPLLAYFGRRGDVATANHLLATANDKAVIPNVLMLNGLLQAHVENNEFDNAGQVLDETVAKVRCGQATGSLTICFNTMLRAHALDRNIQSTMNLYSRMRLEDVPLDETSYAALVQVLCIYRQTASAHKIVRDVMPANNMQPRALHYAMLMTGYVYQKLYQEALSLREEMHACRVKPSPTIIAMTAKAKALLQHTATGGDRKYDDGTSGVALKDAIDDFARLLETETARAQVPGDLSSNLLHEASFLISIHGKRRAFAAAKEVFALYMAKSTESGTTPAAAPMVLLDAIMDNHMREGEYSEVDKCWKAALLQADSIRLSHTATASKLGSLDSSPSTSTTSDTSKTNSQSIRIPPSHRFILSKPLRYFIISQFSQFPRTAGSTIISLIMSLHAFGYQFDNRTWNTFVVHLCRTDPPRALLAFNVTERFLMDNWPGWVNARKGIVPNKTILPKTSARAEGLEYIRNKDNIRYHAPGVLVPQYKTMVYLAGALLSMRGLEATGFNFKSTKGINGMEAQEKEQLKQEKRQIGTIKEIRQIAPRTLQAVREMPRVFDRLQQKLIIEG